MDIHLITIEIGIVGVTALSALDVIDQRKKRTNWHNAS
jgi:hypothetical protein